MLCQPFSVKPMSQVHRVVILQFATERKAAHLTMWQWLYSFNLKGHCPLTLINEAETLKRSIYILLRLGCVLAWLYFLVMRTVCYSGGWALTDFFFHLAKILLVQRETLLCFIGVLTSSRWEGIIYLQPLLLCKASWIGRLKWNNLGFIAERTCSHFLCIPILWSHI